jgi:hypothetical protein
MGLRRLSRSYFSSLEKSVEARRAHRRQSDSRSFKNETQGLEDFFPFVILEAPFR